MYAYLSFEERTNWIITVEQVITRFFYSQRFNLLCNIVENSIKHSWTNLHLQTSSLKVMATWIMLLNHTKTSLGVTVTLTACFMSAQMWLIRHPLWHNAQGLQLEYKICRLGKLHNYVEWRMEEKGILKSDSVFSFVYPSQLLPPRLKQADEYATHLGYWLY